MAEELTLQQRQAVENRGGKLLVSAAAGSGKTKVLVDRLLSYLTDPMNPANVDDFLIITYTKAAASELRGKIAKRLSEAVAKEPENRHLQHQLQRLYLTKISTVHSFCTEILREYAYRLDISSDFRVADEDECFELMNRVIQQVLDYAYENALNDPSFCAFVDTQGFGRDDRQIPEILMNVYRSARCHLDPERWLSWCASIIGEESIHDVGQTLWGKFLIGDFHRYLDLQIKTLERGMLALSGENCPKVVELLRNTLDQLSVLRSCKSWDDIYAQKNIDYGRLTFPAKFENQELKEQIKVIRENCKKGLSEKLRRFSMDSAQLLNDIHSTQNATLGLVALVREFSNAYDKAKRNRGVLDFGDLEHKTLDLLTGKDRSSVTKIATEIGSRFHEVMVDEYQDSNAVQDAIFSALTQQNQNCFMVGDVKQSIYQFRLADPGIFLEKYHSYSPVDEAVKNKGRKILLSNNFRSANNVIQAVNDVFSTCMCRQVGGLVYGAEEQLNEGIPHISVQDREVELFALEGNDNVYSSEANFVADKIICLLDGTHMIRTKEGVRPIVQEDIVILLRSPGSVGGVYQNALESRGIRCISGYTVDMLKTEEIEVFRSFLQVIQNPLQDIPLLSVLTSRVIGFTADDITKIRCQCRNKSIYESLRLSDEPKAVSFLELLETFRTEAQLNNLSHLMMFILTRTHMDSVYSAMPNGAERCENIHNFCVMASTYETSVGGGLNRFLEHLTIMEKRGVDVAVEPNTTGAVRIMSIHKSKGLEFPVVFLCGLSRDFNMESARAQVLCERTLGLGLSCVDQVNAVRYPTLAKQAIAQKIVSESISEEMRVLYVAMTRAQDRLIMTFTEKNIEEKLEKRRLSAILSEPELLTEDARCAGDWIIQTALMKNNDFWHIFSGDIGQRNFVPVEEDKVKKISSSTLRHIQTSLHFQYPFELSTQTPSKQTATQIKGRAKDKEVSERIDARKSFTPYWRKPGFISEEETGIAYGNAIHTVMRYIDYSCCDSMEEIDNEIQRLVAEKSITEKENRILNRHQLYDFFQSEIGQQLRAHPNVIREFKFSILDDAGKYFQGVKGEKVLLQGVVDCALICDDGIIVLDFKTDRVDNCTIEAIAKNYYIQIQTYADALARIYQLPIKATYLYFFHTGNLVELK